MTAKKRNEATLAFVGDDGEVQFYQHPGFTRWFVMQHFARKARDEGQNLTLAEIETAIAEVETKQAATPEDEDILRAEYRGRLLGLNTAKDNIQTTDTQPELP